MPVPQHAAAGVPTERQPKNRSPDLAQQHRTSKRYVRPDEERPVFVRQLEADGHAGLPVQREQLQTGVRWIPTPKKPGEEDEDVGRRSQIAPEDNILPGGALKDTEVPPDELPLNADGKPVQRSQPAIAGIAECPVLKPTTTSSTLCALALGTYDNNGSSWVVGRRRQIAPKSAWIGI